MSLDVLVGNIVSLTACLVALSFCIGIWRMLKSPSRIILVITLAYMSASRVLLLMSDAGYGVRWVEDHRSVFITPAYLLLAIAFGLTYFELRKFRFDSHEEE